MLYNQISEQVKVKDGLFWVFFFIVHIFCKSFCFKPFRARERSSRGVGRDSLLALGCHPCFLWHVDGHQRRGGGWKSVWRAAEVKIIQEEVSCGGFFFPHEARILSSFVSLCVIFDVWHGNEWPTSSHLRILWLIDGSLGNLQHDRQTKSPLFCARVTKKCSSQTRKSSQTWPLICSYNIIFSIITTLNNKGSSGLLWSQCRPLCFRCGDLDNCDGNYNKWPLYFKVQRPSLSKSIWVTINLIMP